MGTVTSNFCELSTFKNTSHSWTWGCMPQEAEAGGYLGIPGQPGLHCEFPDSHSYRVRLNLPSPRKLYLMVILGAKECKEVDCHLVISPPLETPHISVEKPHSP